MTEKFRAFYGEFRGEDGNQINTGKIVIYHSLYQKKAPISSLEGIFESTNPTDSTGHFPSIVFNKEKMQDIADKYNGEFIPYRKFMEAGN